jgi:hypothetical protein
MAASDTNPADIQSLRAFILSLAAIVTSATSALADPTISREQAAAERQAINYANAAMLLAQMNFTPDPAPIRVIVGPTDSLFSLAQKYLGSALKYDLIQQANGMVGITLTSGQTLLMPASQ